MQISREFIHRKIYIFLLMVLAIALPLSEFLMSNAIILLVINFFAEGKFRKKIKILKERKSILIFVSIIIIHFLWIFNSQNIDYALHDIRIKIPLLALPIIIGTSNLLQKKEIKLILLSFILSVFIGTIISIFVYLGLTKFKVTDYRDISIFISHIRFSLMVVLSIFILIYYYKEYNKLLKFSFAILTIWLIVYLFFLHSITGIVIFIITSTIVILYYINKKLSSKFRVILYSFFAIFILISVFWIKNSISEFYYVDTVDYSKLPELTINGNKYNHDSALKQTENGHYIYVYRCEKELRQEWNKISTINYDSIDLRGNKLKFTLMRYLTSLNINKDSVGVSKLRDFDVKQIEKGVPNYLYNNKFSPYAIFHKIMWEYNNYIITDNPNKNSLAQRIEFFKAGLNIVNNNFWFGVGTGDVQDEFNNYYKANNSKLKKEFRHRAHNQYLTLLLTFGIFGFIFILFALVYPIFYEKNLEIGLLSIILIINFLSWLNEDSIETQPGVTFFTFFIVLFVFGYKKEKKQ